MKTDWALCGVLQEEALAKSEQMLEEDAVRFDTFLKENDKKAHEAIKRAEKETKLKQDKARTGAARGGGAGRAGCGFRPTNPQGWWGG